MCRSAPSLPTTARVAVFVGGGQRLVLGNAAEKLQVVPDLFDGARVAVGISEGASVRRLNPTMRWAVAASPAAAVPEQGPGGGAVHAGPAGACRGRCRQRPAGAGPEPAAAGRQRGRRRRCSASDSTLEKVLPASSNARDVSGALISNVTIEVVDPSQLKATEYELRRRPGQRRRLAAAAVPEDGSGTGDGGRRQQVDGFVVHFNAGPVAGRPLPAAAGVEGRQGMQRLLTDPLDLAAASPFVASTPSPTPARWRSTRCAWWHADGHPGRGDHDLHRRRPVDPARFLYDWDAARQPAAP
jgi:flagellar hook-associated protein 1 FlgK